MLRDIHAKLNQENLMQEGSPWSLFPHLFPHRQGTACRSTTLMPTNRERCTQHSAHRGCPPPRRCPHGQGVQYQMRKSEQTWSRFPGSATAQGLPKSSSVQEVRSARCMARHKHTCSRCQAQTKGKHLSFTAASQGRAGAPSRSLSVFPAS